MIPKYTSIIILIGLSFVSCKKDEEPEISIKQLLTSGTWEWVETYYAVRGAQQTITQTPQSAGIQMVITFTADSAKVYHNNQLVASYTYELIENGINNNSIFVDYNNQNIEPTVESGPLQIANNRLEILGGADDVGGNQIFINK